MTNTSSRQDTLDCIERLGNIYSSEQYFFYGGPCSQWFGSDFEYDGITYSCAEQWMMACKARLFRDERTLVKIMQSKDPSVIKRLGKQVANFDQATWDKWSRVIVFQGNMCKFAQNDKLLRWLMNTFDQEIIEASPTDVIWGIGLSETDPDRFDRSKWRGTNWLGQCIMAVRARLRGEV